MGAVFFTFMFWVDILKTIKNINIKSVCFVMINVSDD